MLLVPTDPRGIVLLCGFVASILFGLLALLTPPADLIGWAYIALGVIGYFYIQTRGLTTFVWLLVAAWGAAVASAGNPSGWVETGLGVVLAAVSLLPLPEAYREEPTQRATVLVHAGSPRLAQTVAEIPGAVAAASSRTLTDSPSHTSADPEVPVQEAAHTSGSERTRLVAGPIAIRTIGRLQIEVGGRDITQSLSEPRLEFLFSYLLARYVRGVDIPADRPGLAEEVAHGVSGGWQLERLRRQLSDLKTAHPVFDRLLRSNRSQVSLDLEGVDLDVRRLFEMSRSISHHELIDIELAEQVRRMLDETKSEFLAGFSELERQVTRGEGMAGDVVMQARLQVVKARADLAFVLAQHDLAAGHPARSIPYLRDALFECEDRQDVARVLVVVYLQTGQTGLATQIRREYGIEER